MQDRLGETLLNRRGYQKFLTGQLSSDQFQKNLTPEWASIADPSTGKAIQHTGSTTAQMRAALAAAKNNTTIRGEVAPPVAPPAIDEAALAKDIGAGSALRKTAAADAGAGSVSDVRTLSQATEASGLVAPAGAPAQATQSVIRKINQDATRNQDITQTLEERVHEAVRAVYGDRARADLYSGGQDTLGQGSRRLGSTRHDAGKAGDFYIYDAEGNQVKGDALGKLGQYWLAKGYGGVGMEMKGGGVHLDEHTDRAKAWGYADKGGRYSQEQQQAIARGRAGELPDLKLAPAVAALPGTVTAAPALATDALRSDLAKGGMLRHTASADTTAGSVSDVRTLSQATEASGLVAPASESTAPDTSGWLRRLMLQSTSPAVQAAGDLVSGGTALGGGWLGRLTDRLPSPLGGMGGTGQLLGRLGLPAEATGAIADALPGLTGAVDRVLQVPGSLAGSLQSTLSSAAQTGVSTLGGLANQAVQPLTVPLNALGATAQSGISALGGLADKAIQPLSAPVNAMQRAVSSIQLPAMPTPDAAPPAASVPLALGASASRGEAPAADVARDVSDRRIAHIVTGAYSSGGL